MEKEIKLTIDQAIKIANIILKADRKEMPLIEYVFSKSEFNFEEFKESDFSQIEDTLGDYINSNYEKEKSDRVRKTEFEKGYFEYCEKENKKPLRKGEIKVVMEELGYPLRKSCGYSVYKGLGEIKKG